MPRILAVSRAAGVAGCFHDGALNVDTADCAPPEMRRFRAFNPFYVWDEAWIPVPGSADRSRSVEAVWQGSKLIDGAAEPAMFAAPVATKRPPEAVRTLGWSYGAQRFRYGAGTIGLLDARYLVYLPAYLSVLARMRGTDIDREIRATIAAGKNVRFYDWDDNFDIDDDTAAFSHSQLLADWYAGKFGRRYRPGVMKRAERLGAASAVPDFDDLVACAAV